jgi:hypothetical protein
VYTHVIQSLRYVGCGSDLENRCDFLSTARVTLDPNRRLPAAAPNTKIRQAQLRAACMRLICVVAELACLHHGMPEATYTYVGNLLR